MRTRSGGAGSRATPASHSACWRRQAAAKRSPRPAASSEWVPVNSRSAACWYRAAAIARAGGDEDDHAQTLVPFDWRTREETEAVLALARAWRQPPAILRALDAVTRDLQHRRGAYREAIERFEEFLAVARRYGSIPGQAEALVQLSNLHGELGD